MLLTTIDLRWSHKTHCSNKHYSSFFSLSVKKLRYKNEILNSYKIAYYPYEKTHIKFKKRMSIAAQMRNSPRKTFWSSLQPPGEKTGIMNLNSRLLLATLSLSHWKRCVCKHGITPLYRTNTQQLTQYKTSTEWEIENLVKST